MLRKLYTPHALLRLLILSFAVLLSFKINLLSLLKHFQINTKIVFGMCGRRTIGVSHVERELRYF